MEEEKKCCRNVWQTSDKLKQKCVCVCVCVWGGGGIGYVFSSNTPLKAWFCFASSTNWENDPVPHNLVVRKEWSLCTRNMHTYNAMRWKLLEASSPRRSVNCWRRSLFSWQATRAHLTWNRRRSTHELGRSTAVPDYAWDITNWAMIQYA